ncbi:MAG: TIGR00725 family protein [Dehalococcoidia bacterium]
MIIAVIGKGDGCSPEAYALAEEVGRQVALRGHMVVCGGLNGVMEAACKGAKSAGGVTIGVLPGEDPRAANPYVDIPIATGMGYARNVIVVRTAAAAVAVHGAYGTLSEIALALGYALPVVGLDSWSLTRPGGARDPALITAADASDAVEKAIAAAGG